MQNTNTVAELATAIPRAIPVLERLGIDYCCRGKQSIEEACRRSGVTAQELLLLIDSEASPGAAAPDASLSELMGFIVATHHIFTRDSLATLQRLSKKVRDVHGANHPELVRVAVLVTDLSDELLPHMMKEEQVLFPYVTALEAAALAGDEPPVPFFGTVRNPIQMMMSEHEAAGEKIAEIRAATDDFALPAEACGSYRGLFDLLQELERDLHRHIHLENNILFPQAIAVEEKTQVTQLR
ncbi:MAG TPA: iron-sulfur cluster repair di-iron protein [Thermoanaerobaculia bacterium]